MLTPETMDTTARAFLEAHRSRARYCPLDAAVRGRVAPEPTASTAPTPDGAREQSKPGAWTWAALSTGLSASTCWRVPTVGVAYA